MAFIAGIVNPKRIDYNYAAEAAKKEEVADAAVVNNETEAPADVEEQTAEQKLEEGMENLIAEADGESGSVTEEQVKTEEAPTGSEEASDGVSDAEADTPIKRGRKPSKKA